MESKGPAVVDPQNPDIPPSTTSVLPGQSTTITAPHLSASYSNRVALKTILERNDGGVGLVGKKVVIGGWVKSSKEMKKDAAPGSSLLVDTDGDGVSPAHKDVSCMEIIQTKLPLIRSIAKIFGCNDRNYPVRGKPKPTTSLQTVVPMQPSRPSTVNLLVSDGSCVSSLQVILEFSEAFPFRPLPIGTCIIAEGVLDQSPSKEIHGIEFKVEKVLHIGEVEVDKYPLSKKRVPIETLRSYSHFRPRTTTVASVMRIRSALTFATYAFFQDQGFLSVQVPIITTTDGLGFCEKFRVTTLPGIEAKNPEQKKVDDIEGLTLEAIKAAIKEKQNLVGQLKRSESNREALLAAEQDLLKTNQLASHLEAKEMLMETKTSSKPHKTIVPEDFFSQPTYLTVSGRLHLESYACALGNVYSFGPRFRADRMVSSKHVPEMWVVEAEMAFSELENAMNCAEDYFKFLCKWVLENCTEDLRFVSKRVDRGRFNLLETMLASSYKRITYTEALDVLKQENLQATHRKFETQPEWTTGLSATHTRYLSDEVYKGPVIVYNYPKEVKPFYSRLNDDGKTVAAFDLIIPKGGTFITGSQNEERIDVLNERIRELGLAKEQYEWYLDLRRHGTVKHSGFSLGFDIMVLFATGIPDVREVIPFPRTSGNINN